MICPQCGCKYREGFAVCADCQVPLVEPRPGESMGIYSEDDDKAGPVSINGKALTCPVCDGDQFWTRRSMMNTRFKTFVNFDWADSSALNKVCSSCGYVFWFLKK